MPTPEELAPFFPDYQIDRLLGPGRVGVVYLARQRALERWVAIELLPGELAGDESLAERFRQEAVALSRPGEGGHAPIYDFGRTPAGHFYLVSGYVAEGTEPGPPAPAVRGRRRWPVPALATAAGLALLAAAVVWWPAARRPPEQSTAGSPAAPGASLARASQEHPYVNDLGMRFVPVPITGGRPGQTVLFSIWQTRVQDYSAFNETAKRKWPNPGFNQTDTHPAVYVSWLDAQAFIEWLNQREHASGKLAPGRKYRLPSDHEWSCAAGIGAREDPKETPKKKGGKVKKTYYGSDAWPPPPGSGNFGGAEMDMLLHPQEEAQPNLPKAGYRDAFSRTSPVGSFKANALGLFHLGGNVLEWCEDRYTPESDEPVLRGASWRDVLQVRMFCSGRCAGRPRDRRDAAIGFRLVLAEEERAETPAPAP